MKKNGLLAVLIIVIIGSSSYGQGLADKDDLFAIDYNKKDARLAMAFSALVPGAGQFYSNPSSITAYIFPLLEIGLWYGYYYYKTEGDDVTKQYEQYANQYYDRDAQFRAQKSLIDNPLSDNSFYAPEDYESSDPTDWGSGGHFRLDLENTQHFYEDIGKYNKYIFGWQDWVEIYATIEGTSTWTGPQWIIEDNGKWSGNTAINEESEYYQENQQLYIDNNGIYSTLRQEYIAMRQDAEDYYDQKRMCTYGLLLNHLLAAIDAVRVTRQYNIDHLAYKNLGLKIAPVYTENQISPALLITYKF